MGRNNQDLSHLESCTHCQGLLQDGQEVCNGCGRPTKFMSFQARAEYEVEQWRRYKSQASASATA